ncbi:MAG: DUF3604 domain-containing protein, partial [Gemmatimonadetes bacterium]|nr:DUF3604 domain-containing protein [Gemmatimonadota bacterium]
AGDGRAVAQAFPEPDSPFRARWRSGDETLELERTGPPLAVGRRLPARLHVSGPENVEPGGELRCRVAALDAGGFPSARRVQSLSVRARHETGALVGPVRLEPGEDPCVTLATFSLDRPGLWWIGAEAESLSSGFDLPVRVGAESPRERLVFGDLHWHSNRSDGSRSPSDGYHYARDVVGLDFTARTDHDVHHQFPCLDGVKWPEVVADARAWTDPGTFVVIPAYEWTSGRGHLCAYFRTDPGAVYSVSDYGTPEALWAALDPANVITIPHHPAGVRQPPWNWSHFDTAFVRALEIYSNKGNAEVVDANWAPPLFGSDRPRVAACRRGTAQSAWSQGRDCAVVASTDNHAATPGNPVVWRGDMDWQGWAGSGLAAARVPALTREGLWDAIHAGATYGTTGPRIRLELAAEGHGVDRFVTAHVVGANDLERVELVGIPRRGEQPFPTVATAPAGRHPRIRSLDWPAPDGSPWRGVYLRVIQEDGEMAWSSPVFFDSEPGVN